MASSPAKKFNTVDRDELIADCLHEGIRALLPCEVELYRDTAPYENVGYPRGDEMYVTLGSIFKANAGGEIGHYIMTGYVGDPPEEIQELIPPDTDIAHITGPLGLAVLGKEVGMEGSYSVRGRKVGVKILEVYQFDGVTPVATYDPED